MPRTQGVHPETVGKIVVWEPKTVGKTWIKFTLYQAHTGLLPDPYWDQFHSYTVPSPGIGVTVERLSTMELVLSQFGPVSWGCVLSYQCLDVCNSLLAGLPASAIRSSRML